jgi:UDP-glucose 6-dehydrogenase
MTITKIGICGVGFVGGAIMTYLGNFQTSFHIVAYDKYKSLNTFASLLESDLCFICLPTQYDNQAKTYDMSEIDATLLLFSEKNYNGILLIKSTVLPQYCSKMNAMYPTLRLIHNPEFLSARTAAEDFAQQKHIILGSTLQSQGVFLHKVVSFYQKLFPLAEISECSSEESALTKLACNSFYATKVQFFTELFLLCDRLTISYEEVKEMMLKNGWIHPQHTAVPGHDGQLSFGGACLPKDVSALNALMASLATPHKVIEAVIQERDDMRS